MIDKHSIQTRIVAIVFFAVFLSLGGFTLFLLSQIRDINEHEEVAKLKNTNQLVINLIAQTDSILRQQAESWSNVLSESLIGEYTLEGSETAPVLKLNGHPLNDNAKTVDAFSNVAKGSFATLFARSGDDFIRVATSLKKEDGSRAVGTRLGKDHPAYLLVNEGRVFVGKAVLFGKSYMTKYEPIKDAAGKVIGIRFVGIDIMGSLDYLKQTIRKVVLGTTGYSYVLDASAGPAAGTLLIHPAQEGRNIRESVDSEGKFFIKEILEKRSGIIEYPWSNKESGETQARQKIVVYDEYKDWRWIVASGSYSDEIFNLATRARNIMIGATFVLVIVLLAILTFYLNRIVIVPLRSLVDSTRQIANGDLTLRLETGHQDEVGQVLYAIQQMVDKLRGIIGEVLAAADTINVSSEHLSLTSAQVSRATEQQAAATASSSAALEEVTVSIHEVSALAKATESSSSLAAGLSSESVAVIQRTSSEIESVADSILAASNQVSGLVKHSQEVGGIASVIREIADQTNLLALNAAIEAARAGEQGRGFAVVADEVRKLAERTSLATQQIATVIGQIQQETSATVLSMENVGPMIQQGLSRVREVSDILVRIVGEANESQNRAVEVSHATQEQAAAANDIARSVEQVAQMTEQTNSTMHTNAEAAVELQEMARTLRDQVAYFKVT